MQLFRIFRELPRFHLLFRHYVENGRALVALDGSEVYEALWVTSVANLFIEYPVNVEVENVAAAG
jgi:hypothetical protein